MTANLPARAHALRTKLSELDKTTSSAAEASHLEGLRSDLSNPFGKIKGQLDKQAMLLDAGIHVPAPAKLVALQRKAQNLLEKFTVDQKAATLKRGQTWRAMLEDLNTVAHDLEVASLTAWRESRQAVFAGETPNAIYKKLPHTKSNLEAFKKYEALFNDLKKAFEVLPADCETIARARALGPSLETAAKALNFDVSDDVKAFLEAVLSVRGAPLSVLTQDVLDWLKNTGSTDAYCIRSTERE